MVGGARVTVRDLVRENSKALKAAGPRYTPQVKPGAPNIEIRYLLDAVDALSLADGFRQKLRDHAHRLDTALERAQHTLRRLFRRRTVTPRHIQKQIEELAVAETPRDIADTARRLRASCDRVLGHVRKDGVRLRAEWSELPDSERDKRSALDSQLYELRRVREALEEVAEYLSGPPGRALTDGNALLLLGSWGTGKTHFLCDVAREHTRAGAPVLLLLASALPPSGNPLDAIATATGLASSGEKLLRALDRLGAGANCRALLVVDAINEGDRRIWRRALGSMARAVQSYAHVSLVVSCRRPFDSLIVGPRVAKRFIHVEHFGFEEQEFDAQLEFFSFYGIPAPPMPLITPEFSKPLFLKLLCEALSRLAAGTQKQRLREIASGQKGMTYVLEYFASQMGRAIERSFSLPAKSCWRFLKGDPNRGHPGLAGIMASEGREWVRRDAALQAVAAMFSLSARKAEALLHRMVTEGLLAEDVRYAEGQPVEAVHIPYQRFGDHLIARHLLDGLDTSTESTIRRAFYANRRLGSIFQIDRWGHEFRAPGIAGAVMLELPERLKRTPFPREVINYLPKTRRLVAPIGDVFLDGLYWRSAESFNEETDRLVDFFLRLGASTRSQALEVLVGLASRPGHPYSATRLREYLSDFSMPDRDISWSEFLRLSDEHATVYRLLAWVEKQAHLHDSDESIHNEMRLLSLLLTSSDRTLRDRITRALVLLGLRYPKHLFDEVLSSLTFNDPYVPERMLAAAYGVVMRRWADPKGEGVRSNIVPFARALVRAMFLPGAPSGTKHILMRDYALGIIELAGRIQPRCIAASHVRYVRSGFAQIPSPFRPPRRISEKSVEDGRWAMHMDFENYTIGRLIPGRVNYQESHTEYRQVRRQIARRMMDLGYSREKFEQIDRRIMGGQWAASQRNGEKTDRYGKKYSWIAFFEMYGCRLDEGRLDDDGLRERTSDCDIDPSFPEEPQTWLPPLPDLFTRAPRKAARWLRSGPVPNYRQLLVRKVVDGFGGGPWILLEGHVQQGGSYSREVSTFIRGLLVSEDVLPTLRGRVESAAELGGFRLPEAGADYYTYAGEVPWSARFGSYWRRADGGARRQRDGAFQRYADGRWRGVRVEIPSYRWIWERYHSSLNQVSGVTFPAPALCEAAGLVNHDGSLDLYDATGRRATIFRRFRVSDRYWDSFLLYVRDDLLRSYLEQTGQLLVWIPWGERTLHWKEFRPPTHPPDVQAAFQSRENDFSRLLIWPA